MHTGSTPYMDEIPEISVSPVTQNPYLTLAATYRSVAAPMAAPEPTAPSEPVETVTSDSPIAATSERMPRRAAKIPTVESVTVQPASLFEPAGDTSVEDVSSSDRFTQRESRIESLLNEATPAELQAAAAKAFAFGSSVFDQEEEEEKQTTYKGFGFMSQYERPDIDAEDDAANEFALAPPQTYQEPIEVTQDEVIQDEVIQDDATQDDAVDEATPPVVVPQEVTGERYDDQPFSQFGRFAVPANAFPPPAAAPISLKLTKSGLPERTSNSSTDRHLWKPGADVFSESSEQLAETTPTIIAELLPAETVTSDTMFAPDASSMPSALTEQNPFVPNLLLEPISLVADPTFPPEPVVLPEPVLLSDPFALPELSVPSEPSALPETFAASETFSLPGAEELAEPSVVTDEFTAQRIESAAASLRDRQRRDSGEVASIEDARSTKAAKKSGIDIRKTGTILAAVAAAVTLIVVGQAFLKKSNSTFVQQPTVTSAPASNQSSTFVPPVSAPVATTPTPDTTPAVQAPNNTVVVDDTVPTNGAVFSSEEVVAPDVRTPPTDALPSQPVDFG
jgi:hypothetical protein